MDPAFVLSSVSECMAAMGFAHLTMRPDRARLLENSWRLTLPLWALVLTTEVAAARHHTNIDWQQNFSHLVT